MTRAPLDRWERGLWAAGVALWLACVNAVPFGHYVDDVVWVLLSRRMLHGSLAADWSWFPRLETSLPWGFSLLLAPAAAAAGSRALVFKLASAAMTLGGLALIYAALREELEPAARRAWLAMLLLNGFLLSFDGAVMSEAGYLLLFGLSLWLALERGWLREPTNGRAAALGALAGLLISTRLLGLAWLVAAAAALLRGRRRASAAVFAAASALVAAPYALAAKLAPAAQAYTGAGPGWRLLLGRGAGPAMAAAAANAWFYAKGLGLLTAVYFPAFWPNVGWLKAAAAAAVGALALAGLLRQREGSRTPLGLYAAAYAAACVCWPFQTPRLIAPLYPLFAFWLAAGAAAVSPEKRRPAVLAALAALAVASNAGQIRGVAAASWSGPVEVSHRAESWLGESARPGDLVVSMDVARLRYYAGLRGVHFVASSSAEDFAARSRAMGARWFFVRAAGYAPFAPGLVNVVSEQQDRLAAYLSRADLFRLVHEDAGEGARVYVLLER